MARSGISAGSRNVAGGDGLAVEGQDRLYVAAARGVQVVSPKDQVLGLILLVR